MARIPPNFLFPTNFRAQKNIKRLIKDLNVQGYGIAVYLLETLAETEGHRYPLSDLDLLSDEMRVSVPIISTVIGSYAIFQVEEDGSGKKFLSSDLNSWLEPYYRQVEQRSIAGKISAERKKQQQLKQLSLLDSIQQPLNGRTTAAQQIKEIKKEEKKEEKRSVDEDIAFLRGLSAREIEGKQLHEVVVNVEIFRKTGFKVPQLVEYARDYESFLRKELEKK